MRRSQIWCLSCDMAKQDDYTRYTIRLPTPLYERVKDAAGEASVNSLIVQVLEEKYPKVDILAAHRALDDMLEAISANLHRDPDVIIAKIAMEYGFDPSHFTFDHNGKWISVTFSGANRVSTSMMELLSDYTP